MTSFSLFFKDNVTAMVCSPFAFMVYMLLCMIFRFAEFIETLTGVEVFISLTVMALALLCIILRRTKNIDVAICLFIDSFNSTNNAIQVFIFDMMYDIVRLILNLFPELPDKGGLKRNVRIVLEIFILSIMILCSFTVFAGLSWFLRYML